MKRHLILLFVGVSLPFLPVSYTHLVLMKKYMNRDSSSPYLFPFLESREGTKEAYREYQLALSLIHI